MDNALGRRLRQPRERMGWTQAAAGRELGIHQPRLPLWESGAVFFDR